MPPLLIWLRFEQGSQERACTPRKYQMVQISQRIRCRTGTYNEAGAQILWSLKRAGSFPPGIFWGVQQNMRRV
eukprot:1157061-Pelagomonas_calceolata.AAC.6